MEEIILGIDPGYGRLGWGVISKKGNTYTHIAHGCIETKKQDSFAARLVTLETELAAIINTYNPTHAGVEELFFQKNVTTGIQVAHARGIVLALLQKNNIHIKEIKPTQVKQAVTGSGRARKEDVQKMTAILLQLPQKKFQDDAADALAVALGVA